MSDVSASVNILGLFVGFLAIFGCGQPTSHTSNSLVSPSNQDPQSPINLADGVWAKRAVFTSSSSVLGISGKGSVLRYALLNISKSDKTWEVTEKTCDITTFSNSSVTLTFPQRIIESVSPNSYTYIERQGINGAIIVLQQAVDVLGAKLDDKLNGVLPQSRDSSSMLDQDRDGHPGVTVDVSAKILLSTIKGQIYTAQRTVWSEVSTKVEIGRVSGLINWSVEQKTLGSDNPLMSAAQPKVTPLREESPFTLVKIANNADCNTIKQYRNQLFEPFKTK